jgi:hypothetical protein
MPVAQGFFNERLIVIEIEIGGCRGFDLERCLSTRSDRELRSPPSKLLFWLAVLGTISGRSFLKRLRASPVPIDGIAGLSVGVIGRVL